MSCCGGNCGCGPNCKCGNGCGGCSMYPGLKYSESAGDGIVLGVGSERKFEGSEMGMGASENGSMCGASCTCDPCNCK